jgi:hypothetical protein
LANSSDVMGGCVFRVPKAYPVYDSDYDQYVATIRAYIGTLENLQTVGRNGLHRYNNMDHSMLTAMLAVRNMVLGEKNDLWMVNTEQAYHEGISPVSAENSQIKDESVATGPGARSGEETV